MSEPTVPAGREGHGRLLAWARACECVTLPARALDRANWLDYLTAVKLIGEVGDIVRFGSSACRRRGRRGHGRARASPSVVP